MQSFPDQVFFTVLAVSISPLVLNEETVNLLQVEHDDFFFLISRNLVCQFILRHEAFDFID